MIVKTDAVILKAINFRDSSRILTLYTREFGKLSAVAKGARAPRSKMAGATEPLQFVQAVLYRKESRDLQLLSQCEVVRPWKRIIGELERMAPAMAITELLSLLAHDEEKNEPLFDLLTACLGAVDAATNNAGNALYIFEVRILDLLGFRPDFNTCGACGSLLGTEQQEYLGVEVGRGILLCPACARRGRVSETISQGAVNVLRRFQTTQDLESVMRISLTAGIRNEIALFLRRSLQTHVGGLRDLKSESVFASIL